MTPDIFRECKRSGRPIAGLSAFDYPTALLVDRAGLDFVLVGDSLGVLALGHDRIEDTTMDEMVHHCRAVSRAVRRALVVGDLPSGSYETSPGAAVENARRLLHDGGVGAVKVEGGHEVVPSVRAIASVGIPAVGHLVPQHGGNDPEELRRAALELEEAGACAMVLVGLRPEWARAITESLTTIPTLGYGSGPHCNGQLLTTPAMLGLAHTDDFAPGPYGDLGRQMLEAFRRFGEEIRGTGSAGGHDLDV